jgi:hypothetical protein
VLEYCVRKGILTTWNEVSCRSLLKVVDVVKQKTSSVWRREREGEPGGLRKWGTCVRNSAC